MDPIISAATAAMFSWPLQYMQIQSMLFSISSDYWGYAVVPIVLCALSVHLIFRHFFTISWLLFKFLLSLLLYVQVRDVVASVVDKNTLSLNSSLFGFPSGTIQTSKSIGMHLVKAHVISNLAALCPTCFPPPTADPISPPKDDTLPQNWWYQFDQQSDSVNEGPVSHVSWVDMIRNVVNI